jgi:hypothetical protein
MKAKCYKCKKILTLKQSSPTSSNFVAKQKSDGTIIFECGCIKKILFKIDMGDFLLNRNKMKSFIKNRNKKTSVLKTISADLDFS